MLFGLIVRADTLLLIILLCDRVVEIERANGTKFTPVAINESYHIWNERIMHFFPTNWETCENWIEKRIASVSHDYYFIITKCELKLFINCAFVLVAAVNEPCSGLNFSSGLLHCARQWRARQQNEVRLQLNVWLEGKTLYVWKRPGAVWNDFSRSALSGVRIQLDVGDFYLKRWTWPQLCIKEDTLLH